LHRTEISAILADFLLKFCSRGHSLWSPKNSDSTFEFADSQDPTIHPNYFQYMLYRTEICAIMAHFRLNLVAMVTPFAP